MLPVEGRDETVAVAGLDRSVPSSSVTKLPEDPRDEAFAELSLGSVMRRAYPSFMKKASDRGGTLDDSLT
ncbi:hypothetical protein D3C71_1994660 [compost metagenome]